MNNVNLMVGDCVERMREMADNSVDSVVTDPPYEIGFMGKAWDSTGIANSVEMWKEALRVLKPGGHMLAFSGSRTYHRMTCAIEDAGFEIRDQIMWVYGSGFPKSLDVSKAIDKAAGKVRGTSYVPHNDNKVFGEGKGKAAGVDRTPGLNLSEPAVTQAAQQWQGWGTALKPAHEPICVARKPLTKGNTVAANVLHWGTGALNIDGCRVPIDAVADAPQLRTMQRSVRDSDDGWGMSSLTGDTPQVVRADGRWPANLIHNGSDEVLELFPHTKSGGYPAEGGKRSQVVTYGKPNERGVQVFTSNEGSAARFFYCAKSSKKDRGDGNNHPTVKPTDLMRYLVRLVTPPNGVVLDPFCGSGSTLKAAIQEGFHCIGIDMDEAYIAIAKARIEIELEVTEQVDEV